MIVKTNKKDTKESVKWPSKNIMQTTKRSFNLITSKNDTNFSIEYWTLKNNKP